MATIDFANTALRRVFLRRRCWIVLAVVMLVMMGCRGARRAAVAGKISLDGQPVEGGSILFIPIEGQQRESSWGEIQAGEYAIAARQGPVVGPNRVEIRWPRKTGRKMPLDPEFDELREAIPACYHSDSELQVDVKPGKNLFDFALHGP